MALECGIDCREFFDYSIREITAVISAQQRKSEYEQKRQATMIHSLAALVGHAVNSPKTYPKTVSKVFPELFKQEHRENGISVSDWQTSKANIAAYAKAHNRKRGGRK